MAKKFEIIILILCLIAITLSSSALIVALNLSNVNNNQDIQYILYLGTNDKDTNKPVFSPEKSKEEAEKILIKHFGGYTIQEAKGGWVDNKTVYQEYTLIIHLSQTNIDTVHAAANELIHTFNQSSILIRENKTQTEFFTGDFSKQKY